MTNESWSNSYGAFLDEVSIYAKSGDGGKGASLFLREKFRPKGGPDGGDGGKGGSVIVRATKSLTTLAKFRSTRKFTARDGEAGKGNCMDGKASPDIIIDVPVGTIIKSEDGVVLFDLAEDERNVILLKGGLGGMGNSKFATSIKQAPTYAQPGIPGEEKTFILELKILADVGLVGLPNAGKSTLLKAMTNANPKIANYPFTTLSPNIGILNVYDKDITIADIPGLIEGAHEGIGLGIKFLKHIERTKILLHMVDSTSSNLEKDIATIQNELKAYSKDIAAKKTLLVLNKIDTLSQEALETYQDHFKEALFISAITGSELDKLIQTLYNYLKE